MNIYIDESGTVNNKNSHNQFFVIALVHVKDKQKLERAYKRFISSRRERLLELDREKINPKTGKVVRTSKMFVNGKFEELKGSHFDREMKLDFLEFFARGNYFEVHYIEIDNQKLSDAFCQNTARVFNYTLRLALGYFIKNQSLPSENCVLQLDERNEKTESKHFLEDYLNTELTLGGITNGAFTVQYFDSANNKFIQIADVFANVYYSELKTRQYTAVIDDLKKTGVIQQIFKFPLN